MRLILLGKPGSGKGTQAKRMAENLKVPAISTGDLIRAAIVQATELGQEFERFTRQGHLVPDDLVLGIVADRLGLSDTMDGFILDGFPRTVPQAEALEQRLERAQTPLRAALNIDVPDGALLERAIGRRFCPADGSSYHVSFAKPRRDGVCDACGGNLAQRADDTEDVVRARLEEYRAKTEALVGYYERRGLLRQVDGVGTPDEVSHRIDAVLRVDG